MDVPLWWGGLAVVGVAIAAVIFAVLWGRVLDRSTSVDFESSCEAARRDFEAKRRRGGCVLWVKDHPSWRVDAYVMSPSTGATRARREAPEED